MTDEICLKMMKDNCYYCDQSPEISLNGIDRLNNQDNYSIVNTVSCCKKCNFIKTALDCNTFIKRCIHISSLLDSYINLYPCAWPNRKSTSYEIYKSRANKKKFKFELTKEIYCKITNENCTYCGKIVDNNNLNGIDRINDKIGYVDDNITSCCSECNYMKGSLSFDEFINQCIRIAKNMIKSKFIERENIPINLYCLNKKFKTITI